MKKNDNYTSLRYKLFQILNRIYTFNSWNWSRSKHYFRVCQINTAWIKVCHTQPRSWTLKLKITFIIKLTYHIPHFKKIFWTKSTQNVPLLFWKKSINFNLFSFLNVITVLFKREISMTLPMSQINDLLLKTCDKSISCKILSLYDSWPLLVLKKIKKCCTKISCYCLYQKPNAWPLILLPCAIIPPFVIAKF
jgi:hypothetical protein